MKRILLALPIFLGASVVLSAQHGTAPPGYYAIGYNGDTWTGEVTACNDATREITLTYKDLKHGKIETFVGVIPEGFKLPTKAGGEEAVLPSKIPIGMRLTVFYMPKTRKVEGRKIKYYEIFKLVQAPPARR